MTTLTVGAHNLHDQAGRPTPFADLVLFTETDPRRLMRRFHSLAGYALLVCKRQPDLAIAYRRRLFEPTGSDYRLAHSGVAGVTPHRGTWAVDGILAGVDATLVVEHRINAAFPPYVRGEATFRRRCWETHTAMTLGWVRELDRAGQLVVSGGDANTPHGEKAYRGALDEIGRSLDRLAVTRKRANLRDAEYLGRVGSDHPRLRATLEIR